MNMGMWQGQDKVNMGVVCVGKWRERHTWLPMGNISTRQRRFLRLDSGHRRSCLEGDCLFWAYLCSVRICGLAVSQSRSEDRA